MHGSTGTCPSPEFLLEMSNDRKKKKSKSYAQKQYENINAYTITNSHCTNENASKK